MNIKEITPTVFLTEKMGILHQRVKIIVHNEGKAVTGLLAVETDGFFTEISLESLPEGESAHDVFIREITEERDVRFVLKCDDIAADEKVISWKPVKHWTVHVVQLSHHDVGYSDLASDVLAEYDETLSEALLSHGAILLPAARQ